MGTNCVRRGAADNNDVPVFATGSLKLLSPVHVLECVAWPRSSVVAAVVADVFVV